MPEDFSSGSVAIDEGPDFSKDSDPVGEGYAGLPPLPPITEAQLAEQPSDFWNINAVQLMGDEEAPGGLPRIPVLGPEGSRLRSATEFAGSVEESVAGGLSAMTSRKGMAMLPALAVPYVGPAALAVMGAESVGAGMGEVVTGAELHDPRMAGSGFGQVLLGAPMLGAAQPMIELPRSMRALGEAAPTVERPTIEEVLGRRGIMAAPKPLTEPAPTGEPVVPKPTPEPVGGPENAIQVESAATLPVRETPISGETVGEGIRSAQEPAGTREGIAAEETGAPEVSLMDAAGNPAEFYSLPRLRALDARNDPRVAAAKKYYGARTIPDLARLAKARFEEMAKAKPPAEAPKPAPLPPEEQAAAQAALETEQPGIATREPEAPAAQRKVAEWNQDAWETLAEDLAGDADTFAGGGAARHGGVRSYDLVDTVQEFMDYARDKSGDSTVWDAWREFKLASDKPESQLRKVQTILSERGFKPEKSPKPAPPAQPTAVPATKPAPEPPVPPTVENILGTHRFADGTDVEVTTAPAPTGVTPPPGAKGDVIYRISKEAVTGTGTGTRTYWRPEDVLKRLQKYAGERGGFATAPEPPASAGTTMGAVAQEPFRMSFEQFQNAPREGRLLEELRKVPKREKTPEQVAAAERDAKATETVDKAKLSWIFDRSNPAQKRMVESAIRNLPKAKKKIVDEYEAALTAKIKSDMKGQEGRQRELYDALVAKGVIAPPEPPTRPETPAVPPPPPPEGPKEFGMAAGVGFGGRSFGLDMANLWQDIKALWQRRPIKRDMAQLADAMIDTIPVNKGREAGKELRVLTQEKTKGRFVDNALARKAAVFVIQAKGDPAKLAGDLVKVKGNADAEAAVKYAQANWDALQPLAERTKLLLDEQIGYERTNGIDTEYENHYVPQRHENILTDRGVLFGETRSGTGSTGFKKAKVFPDYASAIEAGYKPRNLDIADLVEHRVRAGQRLVNRKLWADGFRTIDDPYSGEPIIQNLVARKITRPDGTVDTQYSAPQGYVVREIIPGVRIAVRQGYVHLFNALTGTSQIRESAVGRAGLATSGWLKHQLLLLDTFHASRTMQTSLAARGKTTYEKGLSLLELSDRAVTDAVNHNLITSEMASWIRTPQPFEIGGKTVHMTPREVAMLGQKNGMNVGRFADALYNEAKGVVGTNPFTRWLFEKLTRGAMVETFLSEFGRVSKANPTMDATAVSRKVARDINVLFGNLQRQGIIKNPAIRDLMQMVFLAPQWVESLTRRELRAVGQAGQAAAGVAMGKGLHVGTVAKTVGTGLAAYVALTQLLNYLSRGHSTLENEEGEHKLDAFIPDPTGESEGFWFSPLSVFGEITHDFIRYSHTEPTAGDVPQRIQENKLGPVGRSLSVFRSGEDPFGTKLPTTWLRVQEAGLALVPLPIGAKPLIQTVGQKLGVEGVQAPKPGTLTRQAAGSAGFKIEPYRADEAKMQRARQVNTYIEYWTKQARQLPMEQRRIYVERAMTEANFSPLERNKAKREFGEAGVFKYR